MHGKADGILKQPCFLITANKIMRCHHCQMQIKSLYKIRHTIYLLKKTRDCYNNSMFRLTLYCKSIFSVHIEPGHIQIGW